MQAVIMAGGKGTRLAAITKDEIPKPMVPINGKPLLLWQVEELKSHGIHDVIMVIGHLGSKIQEYFGDGSQFGVSITYIIEDTPLGTAGAFFYLKKYLTENPFLLVFGDVYFSIDIGRMEAFHREHASIATLFVHPNSHPADSDLVVLAQDSQILRFDSKHNVRDYWYDNCVNAGFYILDRSICDFISKPEKKDLEKDILSTLVNEGAAVYGYRSSEYIKDIGTVERIAQAEKEIATGFISEKCLTNKQKCVFIAGDETTGIFTGIMSKGMEAALAAQTSEAVKLISQSGWIGIAFINQEEDVHSLSKGMDVGRIPQRISTLLGGEGVYLDEILLCSESDWPNMEESIGTMARKYNIDLTSSWLISYTGAGLYAAQKTGIHTAVVLSENSEEIDPMKAQAELICTDFYDAVQKILKREGR